MNPATITALVTATVALLSSAFAILKWNDERATRERTMKAQRDQWEKTFEDERQKGVSEWQIQFLHDLVQRRITLYAGVLKTLGAVRDVGEEDHRRTVQEHPERLMKTADELLDHLYGESGLVMSMSTRDQLHRTRLACVRFQSGAQSIDDLMSSFFYARRQLRRDIQIADFDSFKTALSEISKERLAVPQTAEVASGALEK